MAWLVVDESDRGVGDAVGAMIGLVAMTVGMMAVALLVRRRRSTTTRSEIDLAAALGPTVDMIAVVLGSGGTIVQAVTVVTENGPRSVRPHFRSVLQRRADGMVVADALASATERLGPTFHPLLGALIATERDGAPVAILLQRLADDAEHARRWQVDTMARRLSVRLLVPLVVCLLPTTVIVAVVPLIIVALRQLDV